MQEIWALSRDHSRFDMVLCPLDQESLVWVFHSNAYWRHLWLRILLELWTFSLICYIASFSFSLTFLDVLYVKLEIEEENAVQYSNFRKSVSPVRHQPFKCKLREWVKMWTFRLCDNPPNIWKHCKWAKLKKGTDIITTQIRNNDWFFSFPKL